MTANRRLLAALLIVAAHLVEAKLLQNYNICGLFVSQWSNDFDNDDMVRTQCFQGIGLTSCQHSGPDPSLTQYPFHPDSMFVKGVNWCLECCNSARLELEFDEQWNLLCPVPEATTVPRIYARHDSGGTFPDCARTAIILISAYCFAIPR